MTAPPRAPSGTLDWLPPRVALRQRVVGVGSEVFAAAGFGHVVTPTFEETALFARTSGEGSDVVQKEMYSFVDRGGRELTLRPEGTAPVVRAYLEHGLAREPLPVKLWYFAPMFRYARAQRGRYREHWQFGAEAIGSEDPAVDAEVIALQATWYARLGLRDLRLLLNSIGDAACRPAYRERLVAFLDHHADALSPDSRERRHVNPLRVFDSKEERDREVMRAAPLITEHLCAACREHLEAVRAFLDARGLRYELDPTLVRGLDYYERTAWEFQPSGTEAAQSAIAGGGRYDGLAEAIGGPRTPGVGFGSGVERLVLLLEEQGFPADGRRVDWYLAIASHEARPRLHALLDQARARGAVAEADLGERSLKGQLRQAGRLGARVVGVCEPEDWARGVVRLGDDAVPLDRVVDEVLRRIGGA